MKIEYSSNNSGGRWWLSDEKWKALEAGGWTVQWCKDEKPVKIGERVVNKADADGRWLGALAKRAWKDCPTIGDAIRDWEQITGLDASAEGCNCCGAPHTFYWGRGISDFEGDAKTEYGYCSGESCLQYLFAKVPGSLREAAEALNAKAQP